ncbi:hypothetical protein I5M32_06035 [Pedobacter sp. SD-b]|uniref:Uncharacterized protein n=1 Tax=Pedobacter segetis TaxID=2793069 RepID=A0ABS1BI47_9SPHI|nr:hypothetical protein [Pedobacter segetis]MBK0382517.1 hypothetical protein [Pedobacter segetis]
MSVKREIKCPHCKKWTLWRGETYDRCLYCNEFLQNDVFIKQLENKLSEEVKEESDIFFVKPTDGKFTAFAKKYLRKFRRAFVFAQAALIAFMAFLLWLIGMLST